MSDSGEHPKYKWTPESTSLLVSVWSDRQVQKQLEYAAKPQLIWESVARYMRKKGYDVSAKQCRSRMKQVLVCYREAKRAGTRAGVEQYYEAIDGVLKNKRLEQININGIDTVDSKMIMKSPPKDMKTNTNLQMRHKFQEPVQSLYRTEALSPTWTVGHDAEYPDSPESNETIVAQPYNIMSPTRDVAINTGDRLSQLARRSLQQNSVPTEAPIREDYQQNLLVHNHPYGEIPYQNTVQNVQNQIIQENMQQNQNLQQNLQQNRLWNQLPQQNMPAGNLAYQQNLHNTNQAAEIQLVVDPMQPSIIAVQKPNMNNVVRQQIQLQHNAAVNNRAMPQEPRKIVYGQNMVPVQKQYRDVNPRWTQTEETKLSDSSSPDYSPDVTQNFNDAFCQSTKSDFKSHNLNETFNRPVRMDNQGMFLDTDNTVVTNNATCNDDSMLEEFMLNSPIPSENGRKSKDSAVNTDSAPNAPFRKKKAQKLEQLVLSAINSQNEVVNKILAAQNDMVSRFLDIDRDRQNRLENRLDHLMNVVHASVLNKGAETDAEIPAPSSEPTITSLAPPPRPGAVPPKLDLVPPKPCRVPCTVAGTNAQPVNQSTAPTRPGVVSPVASPGKRLGTIWSKLGPVSQSPFVKAQQRLGLQPVSNSDTRTQSSAERRIAREVGQMSTDPRTLVLETERFLEVEKQLAERIENARLEQSLGQSLNARRRLFTQREPTAAMILSAAFLETECRAAEDPGNSYDAMRRASVPTRRPSDDDLLAGQGESYDRLRQLDIRSGYPSEPCDSSTPAKPPVARANGEDDYGKVPRQTIQQLAQLVMNSARWKEQAVGGQRQQIDRRNAAVGYNANTVPRTGAPFAREDDRDERQRFSQDRCNGNRNVPVSRNEPAPPKPRFPMGFTTTMFDARKPTEKQLATAGEPIGFTDAILPDRRQQNVRFVDDALAELQQMYAERSSADRQREAAQNRNMIERYVRDTLPKRQLKDKDTDSDNDEEFLDTTGTMHPVIVPRRGSLTSTGTASTETDHATKLHKFETNCTIS